MNFLKHLWQDIREGQNLDVYVTVFVAIIIAVLGIIGLVTVEVIFSALLATVALVSSSLLINRRNSIELHQTLTSLNSSKNIANQFLTLGYDIAKLIEKFRNSQKVYFWGTVFTTHVPLLRDYLREGLNKGIEVRYLLIDPDSDAIEMAAFRSKNLSSQELNEDLKRNLFILNGLSQNKTGGTLEIRTVNYLAPYTMFVFDPHLPHGSVLIYLSIFHVSNVLIRPTFSITKKDNEKWFEHFIGQFEAVWNESATYEKSYHDE